jgi:hypothetical protein
MEPLEIHIPLKIEEVQPIKLKVEDKLIKLKVVTEEPPVHLDIRDDLPISLQVKGDDHITLKVGDGEGGLFPIYRGDMVITPKVREETVLETERTTVLGNITVLEIPYYETSNVKGITFIVGGN